MENEDRRTNKEAATSGTSKEDKTHRDTTKWKYCKKTTADKTENTIRINKWKDIAERKKTQKISGEAQVIQTKQNILK